MDGFFQQLVQYWTDFTTLLAVDPARLAEPDMIARICLQILLLVCSAFFSGSETALFSLSRLDLQKIRRERHPRSEALHALLDQPRRLIISILSGNELVNIAAAANMTAILVTLYGSENAGWINLLVMVPLLLLLGEVTPKTIAISNPVRISASLVAGPMSAWVRIVAPLRWAIRGIADRITILIVGQEKAAENILQVDEFRSLVEEVANDGEINATERALIYNLLEAGDTEIVEIMTPRTRTAFLNADMSIPEMVERFIAIRHSQVPVFRIHRDNIVGFIHAEDIMKFILDGVDLSTKKLDDIMHPPIVVPLTKKVDEMIDFFQENNTRAAAVLNEFGGVEGFLTIKDALGFIFGQISEDVIGQELYQERDDNVYEVPGDMKLTDFNTLTNFGIEDPRMTTIGGVAFRHLDRLPYVGDKVTVEGIGITIQEMDAHRIARVRVARVTSAKESDETEAVSESASSQEDKPPPSSEPVLETAPATLGISQGEPEQTKAEFVAEESGAPVGKDADLPPGADNKIEKDS
uniref:Hemolysin, contains CBS domains n=1 Tax=Candidatus Kentrum sp. MB TaxID=2138164 RepID=A0A450XQ18_9GAMM|nr:MAG: Hemolysin, contains CBS domains [Candidatus Kentron sp. MB]VFK31386.1 MAG: Hemolysin, contains CBS domains [Candidatus Kentron sp. MB]VFK75459.1 MAG: Hemolysin, contains CBS domains [Candidatus Kentron sp. MB]